MAIDSDDKVIQWLHRFGYLPNATPASDELIAAVTRLQKIYQLEPDGWAGPITRRAMSMFRCSHRDTNIVAVATDNPPAVGDRCRWKQPTVRYAIAPDFDLGIDRNACQAIIADGFEMYQSLTGLTFVETNVFADADIQISAGRGKSKGFDGVGNVLALSTLPCGDKYKRLSCVFDQDEPWTAYDNGPGVVLRAVWAHELGHLVGLSHSADPADVMSPYYTPGYLQPQTNDRWRLSQLYGIPFIPSPQQEYTAGAYQIQNGLVVVRHDGGLMISLRSLAPVSTGG